jgi:predicted SAM-dependent methyltransferase
MTNLLNIGCGGHFHEAWTNIDLVSPSPHVRAYDLRKGLPYENGSFDACYTSHVLEHLTPAHAKGSLKEQYRVLKRGGVVRVVVPDLENKAREYVRMLDAALANDTNVPNAAENHAWMTLELLDQMVRSKIGGEMGAYILNPNLKNADYIVQRIGDEAEDWLNVAKGNDTVAQTPQKSLLQKIFSKSPSFLIGKVRLLAAEIAVRVIAGKEAQNSFKESVFRASGELHLWMYDRYSLARLLEEVGFGDVRVCRFDESRIPNFASYLLDNTPEGTVRKADSLFMEGVKP